VLIPNNTSARERSKGIHSSDFLQKMNAPAAQKPNV
jgi:hypothetical protein